MNQAIDMSAFETRAKELITQHRIPSVSLGIAKNGKLDYYKGFGARHLATGLPVTEDTVFGLASVTKSFTCVAIMQLQEKGKLSVHDPVVKYLPEFTIKQKEYEKDITIHHFMSHTAGLPPLPSLMYSMKRIMEKDPSAPDYKFLNLNNDQGNKPIDTPEELMEFIGNHDFELLGPPGNHFSYCNDGYGLIGAIIARVSGKSYEQYVEECILQPAGMTRTHFNMEDYGDDDNIAMRYAEKEENGVKQVYEAPIWWNNPSMRASGDLKSTVADMVKYMEIYRNGGVVGGQRILSEESVKEMMKPRFGLEPGVSYGYGLMIAKDYYGSTLVFHGGNFKAIASQMCVIPEKGISAMILTNLAAVPATTIMSKALNVYQDKVVDEEPHEYEPYHLPMEVLEKFAGEYESNEGMRVAIGIENGSPTFQYQGVSYPIEAIGPSTFRAIVGEQIEIITIRTDENGDPSRIFYHLREFPRIK